MRFSILKRIDFQNASLSSVTNTTSFGSKAQRRITIRQTRKAGLPLSKPQLLHVGAEARSVIRAWAEEEGVSVNAIMVSVLEEFFKRLRRSKSLREELRLELRARRGSLPS
jgi:hypothetical protein